MNKEIEKAEKKVVRSLKKYKQLVMDMQPRKRVTKPTVELRPENIPFSYDNMRFDFYLYHQDNDATINLKGMSYNYFMDALQAHFVYVDIDTKLSVFVRSRDNDTTMQLTNVSYDFFIKAFSTYHRSLSKNWKAGSTQKSVRKTSRLFNNDSERDWHSI